jgi:hypothetical protein
MGGLNRGLHFLTLADAISPSAAGLWRRIRLHGRFRVEFRKNVPQGANPQRRRVAIIGYRACQKCAEGQPLFT